MRSKAYNYLADIDLNNRDIYNLNIDNTNFTNKNLIVAKDDLSSLPKPSKDYLNVSFLYLGETIKITIDDDFISTIKYLI